MSDTILLLQQLQETNQNLKMNRQKKQSGAQFTKPTYMNPLTDNSSHRKNNSKKNSILRNKVKVLTKRFPLKGNNAGFRTQMLKFGATNDLSTT